jgi:hypothetical protein
VSEKIVSPEFKKVKKTMLWRSAKSQSAKWQPANKIQGYPAVALHA